MIREQLAFFSMLVLLTLGLFIQDAFAYVTVTNSTEVPYELTNIETDFSKEQWYLGTLDNYPHLYSLTLIEDSIVPISLRVPGTEDVEIMRPNFILVQSTELQGVEEKMRREYVTEEWQEVKDSRSGLKYFAPESMKLELPAGEYKIEISSASEYGKYMLVVGEDSEKESFDTVWETAGKLYEFYGVSRLSTLGSALAVYLFGFLVLIGLMIITWRYRFRLKLR